MAIVRDGGAERRIRVPRAWRSGTNEAKAPQKPEAEEGRRHRQLEKRLGVDRPGPQEALPGALGDAAAGIRVAMVVLVHFPRFHEV